MPLNSELPLSNGMYELLSSVFSKTFQNRRVSSGAVDAIVVPLGLKAKCSTRDSCPHNSAVLVKYDFSTVVFGEYFQTNSSFFS